MHKEYVNIRDVKNLILLFDGVQAIDLTIEVEKEVIAESLENLKKGNDVNPSL